MLLGPIAWWATPAKHLQGKDKAETRTATRQTLLAAVGGLVLATGAAFTARTFYLTRRGQYTDRYNKAITQLASDKLTERLGGIYALEHLMLESEREHNTVGEVLAAFIRESTRPKPSSPPSIGPVGAEQTSSSNADSPGPPTDVQAALTVLGRRPSRPEPNPIDLTNTDLTKANLAGANLAGANLTGTNLAGADLTGTDLAGANLAGADLTGADLADADLAGATLIRADLRDANLSGANLSSANLSSARLRGANLSSANLRDANLRVAYLRVAYLRDAHLRGANLSGAHLNGADLRDAHLIRADLRGARLLSADLRGADLRGANLSSAHLSRADLSGADLSSAYLSGAYLSGAYLSEAKNLTTEMVAQAALNERTLLPEGMPHPKKAPEE